MASSRPKRQRNSLYSYRDLLSDDDEDFSPRRKPHKTNTINRCATPRQEQPEIDSHGRRNLALKKTSRSQERANAKERAEAVQLERAIRESLASDSSRWKRVSHTGSDANLNALDIADSDDDGVTSPRTDFVAFQYLVDVASAVDNSGTCEAPGTVPLKARECRAEEVQDNSVKAEANDEQSYEEESGNRIDKYNEDNGHNQSECEQKDIAALKLQPENACPLFQIKKARSNRTASRARISWDGNGCYKNPTMCEESGSEIAIIGQDKENMAPYSNDGYTNKSLETSVGCTSFSNRDAGNEAVTSQNCDNLSGLETPGGTSKDISSGIFCNVPASGGMETTTETSKDIPSKIFCDVSGSKSFHFPSQKMPHRRVIGLSRRFQPPPLHPYLARPNC